MLGTSFKIQTRCRIDPGKVCLGKFDNDETSSLAIATNGNRVLVQRATEGQGVDHLPAQRFLNMYGEISCLKSARLKQDDNRDTLLIGSPSSLLGYDVFDNCDKFFVDVPEGVNCIGFGKLPSTKDELTFVGGNCSLQGFDSEGNEAFWTVVGGTAMCLEFVDVNVDDSPELLVGSDDFEIRAFQSEESMLELTETESVTHIARIGPPTSSRFAYALSNGTVGVYEGSIRVWRVKAKDSIQALTAFDIDGDGVEEVITGWSNGKFEARRNEDGQVVYRETLSSPISALLKGDFRNAGVNELICCLQDGEIRGYAAANSPQDVSQIGAFTGAVKSDGFFFDEYNALNGDGDIPTDDGQATQVFAALHGSKRHPEDSGDRRTPFGIDAFETKHYIQDEDEKEEDAQVDWVEMQSKRKKKRDSNVRHFGAEFGQAGKAQDLKEQLTLKMMELRTLEETLASAKQGENSRQVGALPAGTNVSLQLETNLQDKCLDLVVQVNNDCIIIQHVLVFSLDSGVFQTECEIALPSKTSSSSRRVAIRPLKHGKAELNVQTLVSARGSAEYLTVFETKLELPHFGGFFDTSVHDGAAIIQSGEIGTAEFLLPCGSLQELANSFQSLFGTHTIAETSRLVDINGLSASLARLADGARLIFSARLEASSFARVCLQCDSLELASQVVQELANLLNVAQLETSADFPKELRHLEDLMTQVNELNDIRQRLGAEMADEQHYIKTLIVKAEDARILHDITNVTQTYQELTTLNMQMIGEYNKRANNQKQLLTSLKEVNQVIQWASRLRVGKPQTNVVTASRKAIKTNNLPALFHALTSVSL